MKIFCHTHSGFYDDTEGCLYCQPSALVTGQPTRPTRSLWSLQDPFSIDHDYQCVGISWGELAEIHKDTIIKASTTVFSHIPMGGLDLSCLLGYNIAALLMKYTPSSGWVGSNAILTPEFLGVWTPMPGFRPVYVYSDLRVQKQLLPADCLFMTSFPIDSTYLSDQNFDYVDMFDPLDVTITARG
jgi:hypothetical protein